jgi:hypothetical protein
MVAPGKGKEKVNTDGRWQRINPYIFITASFTYKIACKKEEWKKINKQTRYLELI